MRLLINLCVTGMILTCLSCRSIKANDINYTRDPDMEIGNDAGKTFQNYVQTIREGGQPAGSSKTSGGCGCN